MSVNLKSLIGKLNNTTRTALEAAAGLCLSRTHYDVEIEHYLLKLMDPADTDFSRILHAFEINKQRLTAELTRSLDKLKSGNARTPAFSPTLVKMFTEAWAIGSLNYEAGSVRSGFTVLAIATVPELSRLINDVSREFQKINAETLRKDFAAIIATSKEDVLADSGDAASGAEPARLAAGSGKTP